MSEEYRTIPLESKLVAISLAARCIEDWIRSYGHQQAQVMTLKAALDPKMPDEYRKAFDTAFGG